MRLGRSERACGAVRRPLLAVRALWDRALTLTVHCTHSQPFALAVDHDALKRRVMRLESLIINNQYQLPAPPATHPSGGMLPQPAPLANLSGSAPTGSIQPSPGGSVFDSGAQSSHGGGVHHGATPGNNISDPGTASSSAYHHQISSSFLPPAGVATAEGRSAGAAGTKGAEEEDAEDGRDSDTEDAALVLEELGAPVPQPVSSERMLTRLILNSQRLDAS